MMHPYKSRPYLVFFTILTFLSYRTCRIEAYRCGPSRKCECKNLTFGRESMKCFGLNVSDICTYASKVPNITSIDLSQNILEQIGKDDFIGCEHIERLDLSNCKVARIDAEAFVPLGNLQWLDLAVNKDLGLESLNNISYGLQFTKIDFLNISSIRHDFALDTILRLQHICYLRNTTLRVLALSHNSIQQLEINVPMLVPPTLQILYLDGNPIMFGSYVTQLGCFNNITTVSLNYRKQDPGVTQYLFDPVIKVDCIPKSTLSCPFDNEQYLKNISTEDCKYRANDKISIYDILHIQIPRNLKRISYRDSSFDSSSFGLHPRATLASIDIEYLDASGNHLQHWGFSFINMTNAKHVDLSRNGCADVHPDFFTFIINVEHLILNGNVLGYPLSKDINGLIFKPLKRLNNLDIASNQIQYLPKNIFKHLTSLQVLNLNHNGISTWYMDVGMMHKLYYINISSNSFRDLPNLLTNQLSHQPNFTLDMSDNPIQVSCLHKSFLEWMIRYRSHFVGIENYTYENENGVQVSYESVIKTVELFDKSCRSYTLIIVLCTLGLAIFCSLVICGIVYKNRWKLRYFMYMNRKRFFRYRALNDEEADVTGFKYDAFIAYAQEDRRFVIDHVIPNVENNGLALCIHNRDFIAGRYVHENILEAIQNSKKTVVVLSPSFVASKWCVYEFQMSRMESIYARDGKNCVIMVLLEHVPMDKMSPEMIDMVTNNAYIEYTDESDGNTLFWNKLNEAIRD